MDMDAPLAHGEELGGLQTNHALVAPLAQAENLSGHDVVALGDDQLDLAFASRIAVLLGPDRFADPGLAVLLSEIWKQVDRRLRYGVEFFVAIRNRPLDIAGIKCVEEIQHTLPVRILNHIVSRRHWLSHSSQSLIVDGIATGSVSRIGRTYAQKL